MAQTAITDNEILEAALVGLEHQRSQVDERMTELRRRLGMRRREAGVSVGTEVVALDGAAPIRKRRMSAAGRRRIAEAQRKRWAAARREKGTQAKRGVRPAPAKKRRMSAAGRARIAAATKKRWAKFRKKKAAAAKK